MSLYDLHWEGSGDVLVISVRAFWPHGEAAAFRADLLRTLRSRAGQVPFDVIADLSKRPPQSSAVVRLQSDVLQTITEAGMRRLVAVGAGALITIQAKRASHGATVSFVGTLQEACELLAA